MELSEIKSQLEKKKKQLELAVTEAEKKFVQDKITQLETFLKENTDKKKTSKSHVEKKPLQKANLNDLLNN